MSGDVSDDERGRAPLVQRLEHPTLRRLDDAVVPLLQSAARGIRRRAGRVRRRAGRPFRAVARWEDGSWFGPVARNRGAVAFVAVLIATTASAVHLDRYPDLRAAEAEARRQTVRPVGDGDDPTLVEEASDVGPPLGVAVAGYVEDRHAALMALDPDGAAPILAVVSFDTYLSTEQVSGLLPDGVAIELAQYRIPAEGEPPLETEVVGGDLAASIERAVGEALVPLREEETEVERLLESGTVEDEEYEADYERRLSELRSVRNVLETGAPVVFAVVVEAPVGALQELVGEEHVRVVDPAPPDTDLDGSRFYGVRPEDTDRATYGRTS